LNSQLVLTRENAAVDKSCCKISFHTQNCKWTGNRYRKKKEAVAAKNQLD